MARAAVVQTSSVVPFLFTLTFGFVVSGVLQDQKIKVLVKIKSSRGRREARGEVRVK